MKHEVMNAETHLGHRLEMGASSTDFLDFFSSDFFDLIVSATKMYAHIKFRDLQFAKGGAILSTFLDLKIVKRINEV